MANEDEKILTVNEAAALLRVDPQTVRRWANEGKIPAGRAGRNWRFSRKALIEWLFERGAGRKKQGSKSSSKRRKRG